jgi:hypothetical protein
MSPGSTSRAIVFAMSLLLAACGDGDGQQATQPDVVRVADVPLQQAAPSSKPAPDRFARGVPTAKVPAAKTPPAPGTLGAVAVASISAVVSVHNVASSVGRPLNLPRGALHGQAADARAMLGRLRSQLGQAPRGIRGEFGMVLAGYRAIAADLARRPRPLAAPARSRLAALDIRWRRALRIIGRRSGSEIEASAPPLLRPHIPAPARQPDKAR